MQDVPRPQPLVGWLPLAPLELPAVPLGGATPTPLEALGDAPDDVLPAEGDPEDELPTPEPPTPELDALPAPPELCPLDGAAPEPLLGSPWTFPSPLDFPLHAARTTASAVAEKAS
jgi:hypothetical protein